MRSYLISIWGLIDPLYYFCTRLTSPPSKGTEGNIFRIRLTKYKGKSIVLSDGTQINKNDTLVKIHLHNVRLLSELKDIKSEFKRAKIISYYVKKSLPGVEIYIRNYSNSDEIKGIIGITLLNKGCERLGFEIVDITHPIYKWFKRLSFLPISILASKNSSINHILMQQAPSYLFMSRLKLSNMYKL
ncbi:YkoP family protein [Salipaludibacillus sp. CF4.18]|uniref:YkoP family protein n=1 Tax=Salipaludibacillus sp. CF4.18 TaxID=3373081 RepID=UPI003EE6C9CB